MAITQLRPRIALTSTEQANIKAICGYLETFLPANSTYAFGGNMGQESSWNPTILGDGGASYGLCQWQGSRLTGPNGLRAWCAANGFDPASIEGQCAFIKHELPTGDGAPSIVAQLAAGGDLATLTTLISEKYERPSTPDLANRIADAQMVAALMAGAPIPTPIPVPIPTPTPTPIPLPLPPPLPPPVPTPPPTIVTPPPTQPAPAVFDPISIAIIDVIVGAIFKWGQNLPTLPGALPIPIPLPLPPSPPPVPIPAPTPTPAPMPTIPIDLGTLLGMITSQTNTSLTSLLPGLLQSTLPGILQSILPGLLAGLHLPIQAEAPKDKTP